MPESLVSRLGLKGELGAFKSVLRDVQNQVLTPVDVERMAQELAESGGREFVEMVRDLSESLAQTKRELEASNRRCEQLVLELARHGVSADVQNPMRSAPTGIDKSADGVPPDFAPASSVDERAEWEAWNKRFQSLLG